jgi:hypothetical protein
MLVSSNTNFLRVGKAVAEEMCECETCMANSSSNGDNIYFLGCVSEGPTFLNDFFTKTII